MQQHAATKRKGAALLEQMAQARGSAHHRAFFTGLTRQLEQEAEELERLLLEEANASAA